jgi:hypothetical protein
MKTGLCFLIAARRSEIAELRQLALTCALVDATGRLIHALQRERGLANLYLGSQGNRYAAERQSQARDTDRLAAELRDWFDRLDVEAPLPGQGARLFSRIAWVLQGLDALPRLRERVDALAWPPARATQAYVRLVAGLLAVVFEAADSAGDPGLSKLLVALFNLMQGKEYAGQERAAGSALFAAARAQAAGQQHLLHLIDAQERCLQVFTDFAPEGAQQAWQAAQDPATLAALERMRRILCTAADGATLDATASPAWFDTTTRRMDALRSVEACLAADLLARCASRIQEAEAELAALREPAPAATPVGDGLDFFDDRADTAAPDQPYSPPLQRSTLELLREQSRRLQTVSDELATARTSLNERKLIERAKGLLMAHRHLGEEEAHKTLRQMAMNQKRRLVDVADALLMSADLLPVPGRAA